MLSEDICQLSELDISDLFYIPSRQELGMVIGKTGNDSIDILVDNYGTTKRECYNDEAVQKVGRLPDDAESQNLRRYVPMFIVEYEDSGLRILVSNYDLKNEVFLALWHDGTDFNRIDRTEQEINKGKIVKVLTGPERSEFYADKKSVSLYLQGEEATKQGEAIVNVDPGSTKEENPELKMGYIVTGKDIEGPAVYLGGFDDTGKKFVWGVPEGNGHLKTIPVDPNSLEVLKVITDFDPKKRTDRGYLNSLLQQHE